MSVSLLSISGLLLALSVTIFGIQSDIDRQWLPRPDQNFLSWSFGLGVAAGFLAIFSGMCLLIDSMRLRQVDRKRRAGPAFSGYKMRMAPPQY